MTLSSGPAPATAWSGSVRPIAAGDRAWVDAFVCDAWGGPTIVSRDHEHLVSGLDGFVAEQHGEAAGLVTVFAERDACEVVTLNSIVQSRGVGQALMAAAAEYARGRGCRTLWLCTTNDNTRALRFYQMLGMRIVAWRGGEIDEQRRTKPSIPLRGNDGIPIRDEIELAIDL
jgi:GNAT superfamily N-acetyltransferase